MKNRDQPLLERKLPKTYFELMEIVGTKGPYQRNIFILFFLNWLLAAMLIMQTSFLFMNRTFDCLKKGLLIQNCSQIVCDMNEGQRNKFLNEKLLESLSTQFGPYYCEDEYVISLTKMMIYVGTFFGYFFFLFFADNFGRKLSLLLTWGFTTVGIILLASSQNMIMACVALFIAGGGCESAIRINMTVLSEVVDYYLRQSYSVALQISFGISGILIPIFYLLIGNWREVNLIFLMGPTIIVLLLFIVYFQETPKFILRKGIEPALKSLNRIGKINKGQRDLVTREDIENVIQEEVDSGDFTKLITPIDLFRFKSLRLISISVCFIFFFITFLYFGPVFVVDKLGFDPYTSQIIVSGSQLLAYPISYVFVKKLPRVKSGVLFFGLSAFFTGILIFVQKPDNCDNCIQGYIEIVGVFLSRFCIAFYFSIYFLYVNELYPLRARAMGFGIGSAAGAVGSSIGPLFLDTVQRNNLNPQIFMTLFAFLAIIFLIFLPETLNRPLLNEIEEIEYEKNKVKSIKQSKTKI